MDNKLCKMHGTYIKIEKNTISDIIFGPYSPSLCQHVNW